jgi:hypothetical protein
MMKPEGFKSLGLILGITILLGLLVNSASSAVSTEAFFRVFFRPEVESISSFSKVLMIFRAKFLKTYEN